MGLAYKGCSDGGGSRTHTLIAQNLISSANIYSNRLVEMRCGHCVYKLC
jgi:hypothetical protein